MEAWVGPAIVAAIISSLVTITGWYVAHERERRMEAVRRIERIRDVQTALLADIRSYRARLRAADLQDFGDGVVNDINSAPDDHPFTPFVPREAGSLLWASIVKEVQVLPIEVIDPMVMFFSQLNTIGSLTDDLRSERFASLHKSRKAAMYADYIRLRIHAAQLAETAETALHGALGLPPVNSLAPGRSGRRSAGEPGVGEEDVGQRSA